MSVVASQITGVSIVCSTVCLGTDQRKHQISASLATDDQWIPLDDVISGFHLMTSSCSSEGYFRFAAYDKYAYGRVTYASGK